MSQAGTKILVVDDSISVRKALERTLAPNGFDVAVAASAEQALDVIEEASPELVISDVVMPGLDGYGLAEALRAQPRWASLPLLLISGVVDESVEGLARAAGAVGVVRKPFAPEELLSAIGRALSSATSAPHEAEGEDAPAAGGDDRADRALREATEPLLAKAEVSGLLVLDAAGTPRLGTGGVFGGDASTLADYARFLTSAGGVMGQHLHARELRVMALEYDDQSLLLARGGRGVTLALLLDDAAAAGIARYLIGRQLPRIVEILDGEVEAAVGAPD